MTVRNLGFAFLNLVYPLRCAGCGTDLPFNDTRRVCPSCEGSVAGIPFPLCARCGVHLPDGGEHCFSCRGKPFKVFAIRCWGRYEGVLKELIHQFKYEGKDYLGKDLAVYLERAWGRFPELRSAEVVVPVPLHPASFRERGYNQADILARAFSASAALPCLNALKRTRRTESQIFLKSSERAANVAGAFEAIDVQGIPGTRVLIIDDVCTTGSTFEACARALRSAGAKSACGLALARQF